MSAHHHNKPLAMLAAVGCAVAIAACGSAAAVGTPTNASSTLTMLTKYAACMRAHGVSGFPDPGTTETPDSFGIDGYNFDLPAGMNTQSPAYESASKTCGRSIGPGSGGGHAIPARAKQAMLAHAQCMREHGVPNYPDPMFSGGGVTSSVGGPGINPRSPAFQQAQKICEGG